MKILIVDDTKENLYMLESLLQGNGYEVKSVTDGVEALEKASQEDFDMIISDIMMPRMDGFQLCREVKKNKKLKHTAFVFYTATYTDPKDEELALSLGAERFIVKPTEPDVFMEILREVIKSHEMGTLKSPKALIEEETVYLKEYNERLVRKLEDKMLDLERANIDLKESEGKYRNLIDNANDAVVVFDMTGHISFVNPKFYEITGYSIDEAKKLHFNRLIHPDDLNMCTEYFRKRQVGEKMTQNYELRLLSKAGKTVYIDNNASTLEKEGRIAGVLTIMRDITERKLAEDQLIKSRKMLKLVLDTIPVRVFWKDLDSQYLGCNALFAKDAGLDTPEQILGKSDFELGWSEQAELYRADDREVMELKKDKLSYEEPQTTPDGDKIWLKTSKAPLIDMNGDVFGVLGTYEDITDRKRSEELLIKANRTLKVVSECNEALVRISEESELLSDICKIIVESGNYRLAWVGYAEQDKKKSVRPVAQRGYEDEYLDTIEITWADNKRGQGPTGTAIRTGKPIIAKNILTDSSYAPWRAEAIKRGYASSLALPLSLDGVTLGALNIYALEPDSFDSDELKLLQDLASNLEYGLKVLRAREEHKRTDDNLRKLSHAVEQSPASIVITDLDGKIEYVNPKFTEITEFGYDEVVGENSRVLKSGERSEAFYKELWETIKSGKEWRGEFHNKKKSGELFWEHASISPIFNKEGEITNFLAVKEDITKRKEAEETLAKSKAEFEAIFNANADAVVFTNTSRQVQMINPAFTSILGYTLDDLKGKTTGVFYASKSDYKDQGKERYRVGSNEKAPLYEMRYQRKDGTEFIGETLGTKVKNPQGEIIGFIGIIRDITERKLAADRLRKGEQKFRELSQQFNTLLDAIPDSLILLSSDLKVQWANKNCVFGSGDCDQSYIGQKCHQLWRDLSQPCEDCPTLKSFENGIPESSQITLADGKIWAVRSFPILDETGKVINIIELASDVTENIRIRQETMRAGHLASIGELAAGVAHEITNPINGIINLSQLLVNESTTDSEAYDLGNRIINEGNRIAIIVKGLLSFARENGGGKNQVEIGKVISDCLLLSEIRMKKDNIRCKLIIPPSLPHTRANYQQLQQVFLNIINNAHYALNEKYPGFDENKIFEISVKKTDVSGHPYLRIIFYDQGSGIPSDIKDKLVDPFFSTKPPNYGTGLGLSISHGIINNHGGRLSFDSVEGEFTKVIVDMPLKG